MSSLNIFFIIILLMVVIFGIGLLKKKKFKGYLKIFNFFETSFEGED